MWACVCLNPSSDSWCPFVAPSLAIISSWLRIKSTTSSRIWCHFNVLLNAHLWLDGHRFKKLCTQGRHWYPSHLYHNHTKAWNWRYCPLQPLSSLWKPLLECFVYVLRIRVLYVKYNLVIREAPVLRARILIVLTMLGARRPNDCDSGRTTYCSPRTTDEVGPGRYVSQTQLRRLTAPWTPIPSYDQITTVEMGLPDLQQNTTPDLSSLLLQWSRPRHQHISRAIDHFLTPRFLDFWPSWGARWFGTP